MTQILRLDKDTKKQFLRCGNYNIKTVAYGLKDYIAKNLSIGKNKFDIKYLKNGDILISADDGFRKKIVDHFCELFPPQDN